MTLVAACAACLVVWTERDAPDNEAAEVDSAVMIDLPAAEASSAPASDASDGPEQQAIRASAAQEAVENVERSKPTDETKPAESAEPMEAPPPVVAPDPPIALERKAPPPQPISAPATTAQDERAPAGSTTPLKNDVDVSDEGRASPSKHAITLWQKALMRRLESAKRSIDSEQHPAGTVKVAFEIDARGSVASERVAQSSGSATLDKAALLLIKRAAPFPTPPPNAASHDTSFVVPVRFR